MASPFILQGDKEVEDNDAPKTLTERFHDYVETAVDGVCEAIPSDDINSMPKHIRYSIALFFYVVLIILFAVLFAKAYKDDLTTEFLSPLANTNDAADPFCETIPATNTGTFLATQSGVWEGASGFLYSNATYQLVAASYSAGIEIYKSGMEYVYSSMKNLTVYMVTSDLSINLLVWCSYSVPLVNNSLTNYFALTGNPTYIFNKQFVTGSFSSVHGVCRNVTSQASFNVASSTFSMTYSYKQFMEDPVCSKAANPYLFGYIPDLNTNSFKLEIDVRSLVTAYAINIGLITFDRLNMISTNAGNVSYNGTWYRAALYYDPKYAGMQPISCITPIINSTANSTYQPQQCILNIQQDIFAIPFFSHAGRSNDLPEPCICANLTPQELADKYNFCNLFRFLSGVFFWNTNDYQVVFEIFNKFDNSLYYLNTQSFNASFISSYFGETSKNASILQSNQSLYDAFEFCNIPHYGYCSMATFSAFDTTNIFWTVSEYYLQLTNGACANTVLPTQETWDQLIEVPFTPLQEAYQKCHASPTSAATTNIGVTMGNISAVAPILAIVIVFIITFVQYMFGIRIKKVSHPKKERLKALDEFAESLLTTRDQYFFVVELCNRYEVVVLSGILRQRMSMLDRSSVSDPSTASVYFAEFGQYPELRGKLKMTFVSQFLEVSRAKITFNVVRELEYRAMMKEKEKRELEANNRNGISKTKSSSALANENEDNRESQLTGGKSSMWQYPPSIAMQNPMIPSTTVDVEMKARSKKLSDSNVDKVIRDSVASIETSHYATDLPEHVQLILVLNKLNPTFEKQQQEDQQNRERLMSAAQYVGYSTKETSTRVVLTPNTKSYDQWFSSLSAISIKLNILLEKRIKAERTGAVQENTEVQHMQLTQELQYFTLVSYQSMQTIFFQEDNGEKMVFYLLLSILETQGCIILHITDRSLIQTQYQHKVGIAFADAVFSYADLVQIGKMAENRSTIMV